MYKKIGTVILFVVMYQRGQKFCTVVEDRAPVVRPVMLQCPGRPSMKRLLAGIADLQQSTKRLLYSRDGVLILYDDEKSKR